MLLRADFAVRVEHSNKAALRSEGKHYKFSVRQLSIIVGNNTDSINHRSTIIILMVIVIIIVS